MLLNLYFENMGWHNKIINKINAAIFRVEVINVESFLGFILYIFQRKFYKFFIIIYLIIF